MTLCLLFFLALCFFTVLSCEENFDCTNGACLPQLYRCDGRFDCGNRFDEDILECTGLLFSVYIDTLSSVVVYIDSRADLGCTGQ